MFDTYFLLGILEYNFFFQYLLYIFNLTIFFSCINKQGFGYYVYNYSFILSNFHEYISFLLFKRNLLSTLPKVSFIMK